MRVDAERSSLTFVRPFLFEPEKANLALALVANARSATREGTTPVWQPQPFPTTDWLPHVAEFLVTRPDSPAVAEAYCLTNDFYQSAGGLAAASGFECVPRKNAPPVSMELDEVQVILFRNGVGFVVQRWQIKSDSPAVWLDVQHSGRFADPKRTCALRRPGDPTGGATTSFAAIDDAVMRVSGLGEARTVPTRDVFISGRTLPYAVVFFTDTNDADWPREKVLYKLRRLFHAHQAHHPAADQEAIAEPNFLPYLKDQWFFTSLEGGGFAAIDAPTDDHFNHSLPKHLTTEYFLLFVFTLQQRFTLMDLSSQVARRWTSHPGEQSRRHLRGVFERIRDRLFDFTARYQFVQVVQRENHHRVYRAWRDTFQTRELYEEVCGEVREMSEYLHDRDRQAADERVSRLTLLLTLMIGAPSLAIGFWNINISGITSSDGPSLWGAIGLVGAGAALFVGLFGLVWFLMRRR